MPFKKHYDGIGTLERATEADADEEVRLYEAASTAATEAQAALDAYEAKRSENAARYRKAKRRKKAKLKAKEPQMATYSSEPIFSGGIIAHLEAAAHELAKQCVLAELRTAKAKPLVNSGKLPQAKQEPLRLPTSHDTPPHGAGQTVHNQNRQTGLTVPPSPRQATVGDALPLPVWNEHELERAGGGHVAPSEPLSEKEKRKEYSYFGAAGAANVNETPLGLPIMVNEESPESVYGARFDPNGALPLPVMNFAPPPQKEPQAKTPKPSEGLPLPSSA